MLREWKKSIQGLFMEISVTVDVEQDIPPVLGSMRGVEHGLPRLLQLFKEEGLRTTFFVTGRVAELYPERVKRIVDEGHELGCHGFSHERFDRLGLVEAERAINKATEILRGFDESVTSFRAPNLRFPIKYLKLLENEGYRVDSSLAKYKPPFPRTAVVVGNITRVPASLTSSFLRLPLPLILPFLSMLNNPVLFVHPWEFVDMSKTPGRLDCKFNTGEGALKNLREIIRHFKSEGYEFEPVKDMVN